MESQALLQTFVLFIACLWSYNQDTRLVFVLFLLLKTIAMIPTSHRLQCQLEFEIEDRNGRAATAGELEPTDLPRLRIDQI